MKRELLILRHGKSDWAYDCEDFDRPLKKRGKRGAEHMGLWMQQQKLVPDFVISSPAVRAITTARRCCKSMGFSTDRIRTDKRLYEASLGTLVKVLQECPKNAKRILLVGHNPGLELLVRHLSHKAVKTPADGKVMPTATVAHFSMPNEWELLVAGCAKLRAIVRPSSLLK
jgi:phosphohistidine phosphatase